MKKILINRLEWAFLFIGLLFGGLLVFLNPPLHSNDEERHFYNVVLFSRFQFVPDVQNNFSGIYLTEDMTGMVANFYGLDYRSGKKVNPETLRDLRKAPMNRSDKIFIHSFGTMEMPIPFIPHTIFMTLGSVFENNAIWLLWFARLGGLAAFLFIVFYSIKIIPFFKGFIFIWALTPMVLFQAASVTYDTMNNAVSVFIIAYIMNIIFVKRRMDRNDYIIIFLLALVNVFCKPHTILLPLLYFSIPKEKRLYGKWMNAAFLIVFPLMYFLPDLTFGKYQSSLRLQNLGLWKDFLYGAPFLNLKIYLSNPVHFVANFFNNIIVGIREWIFGAVGRFGYSYTKLPEWLIIIHSLVLILTAFFESNKKFLMPLRTKTLFVGIGTLSAIIVIMGMYLMGPVGADMIFGLQGRYFIPAMPLLFLILFNNNFEFPRWEKNKVYYLSVYVILILTYTTTFISGYFYE